MIGAAETRRSEVALLVVGIGAFQQINDMLGHAYGDLVLRAVSIGSKQKIGKTASSRASAATSSRSQSPAPRAPARWPNSPQHLARPVRSALHAGARQHRVKISIGIAIYPEAGRTRRSC